MSKIKFFIQQSWLLIIASFLFGLLIAVANSALQPRIEKNEKEKLYQLMKGLISEADTFELVEENLPIRADLKTNVYKAINAQKNCAGFAFIAIGSGFADKIKLVIAVDGKFKNFLGFKVLSSNETPGFGDRIKDDYFRNQFKNAPYAEMELVKQGNPEEIDNKIVAITGATVSSEAVVKIFNAYISKVKEQLETKGLISNGQ